MHPSDGAVELIKDLEHVLYTHQRWLEAWHRAVICRPQGPLQLSEEACCTEHLAAVAMRLGEASGNAALQVALRCHQESHRLATGMLHRLQAGLLPDERDYDQLLELEGGFRDHLQEAAYKLGGSRARAYSRQELKMRLKQEHERVIRTRTNSSLALLAVWPMSGQAGALEASTLLFKQVATYISRALRPYDILYELGEGQFLICLAGVNAVVAAPTAQRLGNEIACLLQTLAPAVLDQFEIRCGIAELDPLASLEIAVERAHSALEQSPPLDITPGLHLREPLA